MYNLVTRDVQFGGQNEQGVKMINQSHTKRCHFCLARWLFGAEPFGLEPIRYGDSPGFRSIHQVW